MGAALQGERREAKGEREPEPAGSEVPDEAAGLIVEATEETDTKGLPALEDLVKKISPEARELLDELFRAKFTGVKRVPAKALKS